MEAACGLTGGVDILVCNHARSGSDGSIFDMTPELLDGHWQVNTRSTLLLTRAFAEQFSGHRDTAPRRPGERPEHPVPVDEFATGRVIWMTSGQLHGAMQGEVTYAASKAARAGVTPTWPANSWRGASFSPPSTPDPSIRDIWIRKRRIARLRRFKNSCGTLRSDVSGFPPTPRV